MARRRLEAKRPAPSAIGRRSFALSSCECTAQPTFLASCPAMSLRRGRPRVARKLGSGFELERARNALDRLVHPCLV